MSRTKRIRGLRSNLQAVGALPRRPTHSQAGPRIAGSGVQGAAPPLAKDTSCLRGPTITG